jgi:hypothetical protein
VPLAPVLTDPFLATLPAVPFVVGVEVRLGVRLAAAGDDAETRAGVLRPGVPVAGGLLAVAVAMMCAVCCCCVDSKSIQCKPKEVQQNGANLQRRLTGDSRGCGAWLGALSSCGTRAFDDVRQCGCE